MFDLFRKRGASSEAPSPKTEQPDSSTQPFKQSRQGAMVQAEELMHDEVAATEFILHCEFADARLKAAENIHSRPQVERVLQAVRNTDRRVARLMQNRLDICKEWEAGEQQAQQCLEVARRLDGMAHLLPSQVAELDKTWQQVRHVTPTLQQAFDEVRAHLRERLTAQAGLQRTVIDVLARLRALDLASASEGTIAALEQEVARHVAAPEAAALPRNLLIEFEESAANLRRAMQAFSRNQQALTARHEALARWETGDATTFRTEQIKREWQALPLVQDAGLLMPLQERFDALLRGIAVSRQAQSTLIEKNRGDTREKYAATLDALEKALQEGALHAAAEHDRLLRAIAIQSLHGTARQEARLQQARAELHRLQGWARWGGQVSREELLHAAQALPPQNLPAAELAKKVGSLRERWKSLDASAGPAGKDLWHDFDTACTVAYAPAAAHFKQLAEEREGNARRLQSLIDEAVKFSADSGSQPDEAVDWKAFARFVERMHHGKQKLGPVVRQQRKKLDTDFEAAMQPLTERLARQRGQESDMREKLIAEAASLKPQERGALDALRALQERWQQHAQSMPLVRKQEQEMWQRFRQACDAVFAGRKEASAAADVERRRHLAEKEALCVRLEAGQDAAAESVSSLLREVRTAWEAIGVVPRAAEKQIDARYRQAFRGLQDKLELAQRRKAHDVLEAVRRKLALCQTLEQQLASEVALGEQAVEQLHAAWRALPSLPAAMEKSLAGRLDAALDALRSGDTVYLSTLQANQPLLQRELLRLEIAAGLDSPAELMRERLQLQVEVLQSSFKSGQKASTKSDRLDLLGDLCRLPALTGQEAMERITRIVDSLTKH